MSNEFTLSNLRQIIKDSENGIEQMVTLIPLFPIEIINEYWGSVWLQEPSNPDDRWKSDWIRAIISAYAVDGSIPSIYRNGINIKRSNRERVGTWTENENTLSITDEWNHIPINILNTVINRLKIKFLRFGEGFYNNKTAIIFTKWIESPCPIIDLMIHVDDDNKIPNDIFIKIENNLSNKIQSLTINFISKYGSKPNYFKIGRTFLNRFNNLEKFNISSNLDEKQHINFSVNKKLIELKIEVNVKNNEYCTLSGISACASLNKIVTNNTIIEDFDFENKINLKTIYFNNIKLKENLIGNFTGYEFKISNSEIGEVIKIEYVNKLDQWGRYYNNFWIENTNTINKLILSGFISSIKIERLNELKDIDINCSDSINELKINKLYSDFNSAHIKSESIGNITISNCKQNSLPLIKSNSPFKKDSTLGTNISIYYHDTKTLDGIEGISNIKRLELYGLNLLDKFFNSTQTIINVLEKVRIEKSSINDINNINSFDNLTSLELLHLSNLNNLQPVAALKKLELLDLTGCQKISTLEPLLDLLNLKELKLSSCDSLKPKPKKVFLTGLELKKELLRYSKDKSRKNQFDTNHLDKFISLVKSFNPEDILQACTLIDLFDDNTIEQIFYGISYNAVKQAINLPSLPKNIQNFENETTILALKLLISTKKIVNYPNIRESINQININKSETKSELNKLQIGNYELFKSLFKDLGELNDLINIKIFHINTLDNVDLTGIDKLEKLEKVYMTNVKSFSNMDNLFKCYSLTELSILGTNENIIDFGTNIFKMRKLTLAGSFSKFINYNNIFSLEEIEIQSQNKLNLVLNENLIKLKKIKLVGQFGSIDGIDCLPCLEELIMPLAKIDDPKALFNAIHSKIVKKYSLGTFSFK